jgi:hypothetical protein
VTKRKNYCSDRCAPSSAKDRQKQRAKDSRKRKAQAEKREAAKQKQSAFLNKLDKALSLMVSKKVADQQAVFPLVKKLGGWSKVELWKGKTAAEVDLQSAKAVKQTLREYLVSADF